MDISFEDHGRGRRLRPGGLTVKIEAGRAGMRRGWDAMGRNGTAQGVCGPERRCGRNRDRSGFVDFGLLVFILLVELPEISLPWFGRGIRRRRVGGRVVCGVQQRTGRIFGLGRGSIALGRIDDIERLFFGVDSHVGETGAKHGSAVVCKKDQRNE